jgi:hypothetical protein
LFNVACLTIIGTKCERGGGISPLPAASFLEFEDYYGMVTVVASPALLMVKVPVARVVA